MSKKYWWEEDDQQTTQKPSNQTNSQTGNQYWWEEDTKQSSSNNYWWDDGTTATKIGNNIVNQVNGWLKNHDSYISDYQKRNANRKYSYEDSYVSDSGTWLEKAKKQKSGYDAEADEILSYIDQHKGYLDSDWVKEITNTLTSARSNQDKIIEAYTKDNEWWNSFGSEDLVKEYGSAEEAYKYYQRDDKYRKAYEGMSSTELSEIIDKLEDGDEKDWLNSYKSSVVYDERSKADLNAMAKEIEDMENLYNDSFMTEAFFNMYEMNPGAWTDEDLERNMTLYKTVKDNYGSIENLEKQISEKKKYLEESKQIQDYISWSSVTENDDFAANSKYVSNLEYGLLGKPEFTDKTYAYVNNPTVEDKRLGGGQSTARELIGWENSAYGWDTPNRNRESSYEREIGRAHV